MRRQLWWWRATLEWRIRRLALRRLTTIGLAAPFTWQDYVAALQREVAGHTPHSELRIELVNLGAGDFGRWVITCAPAIARSIQPAHCVEWLELPSHVADDHLEHIAFHEIGHRELGHLAILHGFTAQPVPLTADTSAMDAGQRAISPSRSLPSENGGFTVLRGCAEASDEDEPLRHQAQEREAEVFATLLTRLAHGWDPGALATPRLEQIFDLLS